MHMETMLKEKHAALRVKVQADLWKWVHNDPLLCMSCSISTYFNKVTLFYVVCKINTNKQLNKNYLNNHWRNIKTL